ncbi:IS110 family transposase [Xanthomonas translucens]|nr:transposase [Xanthomonas translucens]
MPLWIGIDVAKDTLAVHVLPLDQLLSFPNTAQGHQRLCDHLAGQSVGNALLEATGGYERAVMTALATAGIPVTRINPRRARAFATALGTTAKTDPLDAALLARMAQLVQAPAPVPDPLREQLRMLVQRR